MIKIDEIMSSLNLQSLTNKRTSLNPDNWSVEDMLTLVTKIGKTFDPRFVIDDDNREVYTNLIYWTMGDSRMQVIDPNSDTLSKIPGRLDKGIYIAGPTGSGKTVAMQVLRTLYKLNPYKTSTDKRIDWIERRADQITDYFASTGDLDPYKKEQLLCIQDLGCEPQETLYMGNRVNVLKSVIEYRGDRRDFITMATSNIPLGHSDLAEQYGNRATSRMGEMMNYLILSGVDRRKNF